MSICEQMTALFPVRKTSAQKQAFREWMITVISGMGYAVQVEQNDQGRHHNVVVGDPEQAQVTYTAHYDTPSTILLPDLQIPRNYPVYLLWQFVILGGMLLLSLLGGIGLGISSGNGKVTILGFFAVFVLLMVLQMNGVANKNNVNDNTSGVALLLETMEKIPQEERHKVAFIFFDNMEKGRKGSKAYARDHMEMQHTHFIVNADSVGVGDVFVVSAPTLAMQLPQYAALEKQLSVCHEREVCFFSSLTTRGNSDFRSFKCGVGITAYRRVPGIGLFLGKLHTSRDTAADQRNIERLAEAFSALVREL